MRILVRNYVAASFLLEQEPGVWDVIAILDTGLVHTDFVAQHARRHIYLRFDDVLADSQTQRAATQSDVQQAVEFAEESANLLVCCRAGQSRSAALAYAIGHQHGDRESALQLLDPTRHCPNQQVVSVAAKLLDEPDVAETFEYWKAANSDIHLADYVDEIEREFEELEQRGARNRIVR